MLGDSPRHRPLVTHIQDRVSLRQQALLLQAKVPRVEASQLKLTAPQSKAF